MSICKQPALTQISTGQAGPEVNRDLEQLFRAVNRLIRCVSRIADFADSQSGGGFSSGSGSSGGLSSELELPGGSGSRPSRPYMLVETGVDFEVSENYSGIVYVNPSADIDVELPSVPAIGQEITIVNISPTFLATITKSATPVGVLQPGSKVTMLALADSNMAPVWPDGGVVESSGGSISLIGNLYLTDSGDGILFSTSGNVFEMTLSSGGVIATADQGTTTVEPS